MVKVEIDLPKEQHEWLSRLVKENPGMGSLEDFIISSIHMQQEKLMNYSWVPVKKEGEKVKVQCENADCRHVYEASRALVYAVKCPKCCSIEYSVKEKGKEEVKGK
jgi:Zn finger protein HypA/HybF involved in hydrogenase expression